MPDLESVRIEKCQNWNMSVFLKIRNRQNGKVSKFQGHGNVKPGMPAKNDEEEIN